MSESGANGGAPGGAESGGAGEAAAGGGGEERTWRVRTERLRVTSGDLRSRLRQLVHEGNVRRIIIRGSDDHVLIDIPVTAGVVGVVLAPVAVAVGAVAALAVRCTIEIERLEEAPTATSEAAADEAEAAAAGKATDDSGPAEDSAATTGKTTRKTGH